MSIVKPSIPKGTRDFTPTEMLRRNYIMNAIKTIFQKYAYLPIETPAMEQISTLMGKYGEEGDRLIFKVLNSGDFMQGVEFQGNNVQQWATKICEKGLRYDLTVPFARFVAQHQSELTFPFKRYQMQPVWRADRPQKGRYREFYQCDVDVIGSNSLLNEAELLQITAEIFAELGINVTTKINNRKILSAIAQHVGEADKITDICTAIDKLDKIGREKVCAELLQRGVSAQAIKALEPYFNFSGSHDERLEQLRNMLENIPIGKQGIAEIEQLFYYVKTLQINAKIELDITLARGLSYYTGAIFEVKAQDVDMGSIAGGGRYDDLTGIFGLKAMSGVGISYGVERIYDIMTELQLFPQNLATPVKALFLNFGAREEAYCLPVLQNLRKKGIVAEIYPDHAKIGKQMNYANAKSIPFVIIAGEDEIEQRRFLLKNMETGEQTPMTIEALIESFS